MEDWTRENPDSRRPRGFGWRAGVAACVHLRPAAMILVRPALLQEQSWFIRTIHGAEPRGCESQWNRMWRDAGNSPCRPTRADRSASVGVLPHLKQELLAHS